MSPRSRARLRVLSIVVAVGLVAAGPVSAEVDSDTHPTVVDARPLPCLNTAFADYGNSGDGWTGADSTWSAALSDGREVFAFSDTFVPPINPPGRPDEAGFINNSLVVRGTDGQLSTLRGGTEEDPTSLLEPQQPDHWYWLGAATALDGALQIPVGEWRPTGSGPFDIEFAGSSVARFEEDDLENPASVTALPRARGIQWGQWIQPEGQWTYVYGVETAGADKHLHVARVAGGDLRQPLSFWNGSGWSESEADSVRVISGVNSELSVHRLRDGRYMLVTMAGGDGFSDRMIGRFAAGPTGPFSPAETLYETPETGASGVYADPDVYTYNAHVHPEFSTPTKLVISYNVNSIDTAAGGDLYRDVSIYRPRFITVTLVGAEDEGVAALREPCA